MLPVSITPFPPTSPLDPLPLSSPPYRLSYSYLVRKPRVPFPSRALRPSFAALLWCACGLAIFRRCEGGVEGDDADLSDFKSQILRRTSIGGGGAATLSRAASRISILMHLQRTASKANLVSREGSIDSSPIGMKMEDHHFKVQYGFKWYEINTLNTEKYISLY